MVAWHPRRTQKTSPELRDSASGANFPGSAVGRPMYSLARFIELTNGPVVITPPFPAARILTAPAARQSTHVESILAMIQIIFDADQSRMIEVLGMISMRQSSHVRGP